MANEKMERNPKILHRIYFENFAPYYDPFEHYLETWRREMPDYTVMKWNQDNLDVHENEWVETAWNKNSPVFLSEYFRWKVLSDWGGVYLDADCEIINGVILKGIINELYNQEDYDVFFGIEERSHGHPTAQTVGAKKGAELVAFMKRLYEKSLPELWPWRQTRGLIGPQLMALYYLRQGINVKDDGFFKNLDAPTVVARAKVYPQEYFSPKFSLLGETLNYNEAKTCIYHLFANANMSFAGRRKMEEARDNALSFSEYRKYLADASAFPRIFDLTCFSMRLGTLKNGLIEAHDVNGLISYGPYISLPKGRYVLTAGFETVPSRGSIHISISQECGAKLLAEKALQADEIIDSSISLSFDVTTEIGSEIEFLTHGREIDHAVIKSMEVAVAPPQTSAKLPSRPHMKLLHRIYFGFDGKPDIFGKYLETWKKQLPDFEIVNWNASNLPMDINSYVRTLYKERDHAFLTDYFRWYVLREYGGTYLDADVEVVNGDLYRVLIEELERASQFEAFIGIDEKTGGWYTAHSMASKPRSKLSRFMCDLYENFGSFTAWRKKGFYFWAPQLVALYFTNRGHNPDGMGTSPELQNPIIAGDVKIYPQDWFSPLAPTGNRAQPFQLTGVSANNCLCHHFACSWHDPDSPYLIHSQEKGGQANVLLGDIIAQTKNGPLRFSANNLSIGVGQRVAGCIGTTGASGCLCFGPYIELAAGSYIVTYVMNSRENVSGISVDVVADFGETFVGQGNINPREIVDNSFGFSFAIKRDLKNVEFRIFVEKETQINLSDIIVGRQGPD